MAIPPLTSGDWFRAIPGKAGPDDLRLFCFPYAGGGSSIFRLWGDGLPEHVQTFAIQLPGREDRFFEEPHVDIESLLDELLPAFLPLLDRPFMFFGHSMGAIIAWEVGRRLLRDHGIEPNRVFASGCRALHLHESHLSTNLDISDQGLIKELRQLNGTPEELLANPEFKKFILPTFRSDYKLFADYKYRDYPHMSCPVTVFGGNIDPRVDPRYLKYWQELTSGQCEVEVFQGGHMFLNDRRAQVLESIDRNIEADRI